MGGLSFWHILVIAAVVLAVFGHREIPALFGMIGKLIGALRRTAKGTSRQPEKDIIEGTYTRRDD